MSGQQLPGTVEKLTRIWSDRRERHVAVRIRYTVESEDTCTVYTLAAVEHLDGE